MWWWAAAALADSGAIGVDLAGGLCAGGPAAGVQLAGERKLDVLWVDRADEPIAPLTLHFGADLALFGHTRGYGTFDPIIFAPTLQTGALYGETIAVGPVLRVDGLLGGASEQYISQGFGARYAAILEDPLLLTAYPSAGVLLESRSERGAVFAASLTAGLPFWSFDVLWPTVLSPSIAYTHRSGARFALRAARYRLTAEVGRRW